MQTKTKGIIYGIIYIAIFLSGKSYIGQTIKSLAARKRQHESDARRGSPLPFHAAIRKYGAENISWKIIARADNIAALNAAEISAIAEHNTIAPNGYNANTGGENYIPCGETRAKLSAAKKGVPKSAETRAKMSAAAKARCTPEWRAMFSAINKKAMNRPEVRARSSAVHKARFAAMSDEEKAKIVAKMAAAKRGKKLSAEHRAKMAESQKARYAAWTEKDRAEWGAKTKARWAARYTKLQAAA